MDVPLSCLCDLLKARERHRERERERGREREGERETGLKYNKHSVNCIDL